MKHILSFDIGIKNLAYTIIRVHENGNNIIDWNIVCLISNTKCTFMDCHTKPFLTYKNKHYCKTHAKHTNLSLSPFKKPIHKMKIDELRELFQNIYTIKKECPKKRSDIISCIRDEICYPYKQKHSKNTSLVSLGREIRSQFDSILDKYDIIDYVLIENQMTSRMRCIQYMLVQYFIMKDIQHIECISASKKLSNFLHTYMKEESGDTITYKNRKALSVNVTKRILSDVPEHLLFFQKHSKKDDLADCFLQGCWYIFKLYGAFNITS